MLIRTSLRGWRPQGREGSSPFFRTIFRFNQLHLNLMAQQRRPRGRLCCVCANDLGLPRSFSGIIAAMPIRSSNAYYAADVAALVGASPEEVIGALVTNSSFSVEPAQRDAWLL